jgi:regulator of cell morphogenesis and NO signaling
MALQSEMLDHMQQEEQVLFPIVRRLETGTSLPPQLQAGVEGPIRCMETEHARAGRALETMRRLTSDFTLPDGACNTFRAMLDALKEFESDLHLHVHKENNIIFPRALDLCGRLNEA